MSKKHKAWLSILLLLTIIIIISKIIYGFKPLWIKSFDLLILIFWIVFVFRDKNVKN